MKTKIFTVAILLFLCISLSAQFVGDGATKTTAAAPSAMEKPSFIIKLGMAMPLSNYGTIPKRLPVPQYSTGTMGAKTGFFAEMGMGLSLSKPDKKVGFYYYPILASYWQTTLDWKSLGGFFADKAIYTKPMRLIDIGQRYGVSVKPIKDLILALYYRPGLVIPLDFEMTHDNAINGEKFRFTGTMSTAKDAPVFMMSHTAGFSVRYLMGTLSFEAYNTRPTLDVHYQDLDSNPLMNADVKTTGRIPVKMLLISLALNL